MKIVRMYLPLYILIGNKITILFYNTERASLIFKYNYNIVHNIFITANILINFQMFS